MAKKTANRSILTYNEFLARLKKGEHAPVYLFLGDEEFLAKSGANVLKTALFGEADYSWDLMECDANEILPGEVVAFLNTFPILGGRRVVIIHDFQLWKAPDMEGLLPLLEDMPDFGHLIVLASGLDKRTKWYKAANNVGQVVDVSPLQGAACSNWVMERGRALGLKIPRNIAEALIDSVGLSLWQLDKELEKLATYKGEDNSLVTKEEIALLAVPGGDAQDNAIFRFVDALVEGERPRALELLAQLLDSGREPLAILAMIARQWRIMAFAWEANQNAIPLQDISREIGVPGFALQRALTQSLPFGPRGIRRALALTLKADREIKTGHHPGARALEILVVRLTK